MRRVVLNLEMRGPFRQGVGKTSTAPLGCSMFRFSFRSGFCAGGRRCGVECSFCFRLVETRIKLLVGGESSPTVDEAMVERGLLSTAFTSPFGNCLHIV